MSRKDVEAQWLAEVHYQIEPGTTGIYRIVGTAEAEGLPREPTSDS